MSPDRPHEPEPIELLRQAQQADLKGDNALALRLYREALVRQDCWRTLIAPSIERISRRMHDERLAVARGSAQPQGASTEAPGVAGGPAYEHFCQHSYEAYAKANPAAVRLPDAVPLVSVIMTAYNAADTIQTTIETLLNQDYPRLEIVVCDDASTDTTWDILLALSKRCRPLKVLRLNANYGTYLAKNAAIRHASGEIVLFHDSDDLSHPARVRVQAAPLLADAELMATRTKYLRFDEHDGRVLPVAGVDHKQGLDSKYGLITLAVRRQAFREIGHFDAVRRAGDDEWVQRLVHVYGPSCMKSLDVTLYAARLRDGSLVADMVRRQADGSIDQRTSPPRQAYVALFRARFREQPRSFFGTSRFPLMPLRPLAEYPQGIVALPPVERPVYAALCSIPSRQQSLLSTLWSLYHQVDRIFLYLDKYDAVPEFVEPMRKVTVLHSQDAPGLRDNAKFLPFDGQLQEHGDEPFYWFTCDDDILYPSDYVHTMLRQLAQFDDRVVVGVHGVVSEEQPRRYFRNRYVIHYEQKALHEPRLVNNLGTGTVAFRSDLFGSIDPYGWPRGGMVDIFFGALCAQRGVPMVCVPRHAGWLQTLGEAETTPNLTQEGRDNEAAIIEVLERTGPWGLQRIRDVVHRHQGSLRARLERAMPAFVDEARVQFDNYRNNLAE